MKERYLNLREHSEDDAYIAIGMNNWAIGYYSYDDAVFARYIVNHWDKYHVFSLKAWGTKGYK